MHPYKAAVTAESLFVWPLTQMVDQQSGLLYFPEGRSQSFDRQTILTELKVMLVGKYTAQRQWRTLYQRDVTDVWHHNLKFEMHTRSVFSTPGCATHSYSANNNNGNGRDCLHDIVTCQLMHHNVASLLSKPRTSWTQPPSPGVWVRDSGCLLLAKVRVTHQCS